MKKISLKVMTVLLVGSMMCSSCMVGSFSLFNKYREWQTNMTSNKYVNAIVAYVLGSICYPITTLVDVLVLNTIEFWSGNNPMAANIGKTQQVQGKDGLICAVTTLKNGYEIKTPAGETVLLSYNKDNNSWSMTQNGQTQEIFRFNADGTISATMNNESRVFALTEQGVNEARLAAQPDFFAMR
jgi:hypothetical protein